MEYNLSLWQILVLKELADVLVETSSVVSVIKDDSGDIEVRIKTKKSENIFCNLAIYPCGTTYIKYCGEGTVHSDHLNTSNQGRDSNLMEIRRMIREINRA